MHPGEESATFRKPCSTAHPCLNGISHLTRDTGSPRPPANGVSALLCELPGAQVSLSAMIKSLCSNRKCVHSRLALLPGPQHTLHRHRACEQGHQHAGLLARRPQLGGIHEVGSEACGRKPLPEACKHRLTISQGCLPLAASLRKVFPCLLLIICSAGQVDNS